MDPKHKPSPSHYLPSFSPISPGPSPPKFSRPQLPSRVRHSPTLIPKHDLDPGPLTSLIRNPHLPLALPQLTGGGASPSNVTWHRCFYSGPKGTPTLTYHWDPDIFRAAFMALPYLSHSYSGDSIHACIFLCPTKICKAVKGISQAGLRWVGIRCCLVSGQGVLRFRSE